KPQRARKGGGLPVSVWNRRLAAAPLHSAAIQPRHFGGGAGFIDKDQALGIDLRLSLRPSLAPRGDVGPGLLGGVRRFFNRHAMAVEEAPQRRGRKTLAVLLAEHV